MYKLNRQLLYYAQNIYFLFEYVVNYILYKLQDNDLLIIHHYDHTYNIA